MEGDVAARRPAIRQAGAQDLAGRRPSRWPSARTWKRRRGGPAANRASGGTELGRPPAKPEACGTHLEGTSRRAGRQSGQRRHRTLPAAGQAVGLRHAPGRHVATGRPPIRQAVALNLAGRRPSPRPSARTWKARRGGPAANRARGGTELCRPPGKPEAFGTHLEGTSRRAGRQSGKRRHRTLPTAGEAGGPSAHTWKARSDGPAGNQANGGAELRPCSNGMVTT